MDKLVITEEKDKIIVDNIKDFHPVHIFECGQCFRWSRQADGSFIGVANGKVIRIRFENERLEIFNATEKDFKEIWYEYFDLGRDYGYIKQQLAQKDPIMKKAVEFGNGIRLLKQDIWETLISFIISANNMIPKIKKTVDFISSMYGDEQILENSKFYAFPSIEKICVSSVDELRVSKAGFRSKYILDCSKKVCDKDIDIFSLTGYDTDVARKILMQLPGVGPKVADCVMLFSGTKYDVFPTDVWVKRVMEELYFKREASFKEIQQFAREHFGDLCGFAQQYLFYYARENKIGV